MLPLGTVNITNRSGSVDLGVPGGTGFNVLATTRHGEVKNDFALRSSGSDDSPELAGTVGNGGASVHIQTTDGDVTIHKSSAAPLAPQPGTTPQNAPKH